MTPTKRKELEAIIKQEILSSAESGKYAWSQVKRVSALFDRYLQEEVEQAKIKAFDDGYDAGRNATPPSLRAAVEFRQEQYGWNDSKMAAMLDLSKAHYSEFKHGKRSLPVNSIRKAYAIGIPAEVLLHDQLTPPQQPVKEDE